MALAPRAVAWPFANPVSRFLGDVSYGVFLLHFMVIEFALHTLDFSHDGTASAFAAMFAFAIPVTVALAWVSWVLGRAPGPPRRPAPDRCGRRRRRSCPLSSARRR